MDVCQFRAKEETDTLIRDSQHMGEGKRRHRRRRSAPDALSVKSMDTWIKEELNSAEYIPYNQQQPMVCFIFINPNTFTLPANRSDPAAAAAAGFVVIVV